MVGPDTTTTTTDTIQCPGPWCLGGASCNCAAPVEKLRAMLQIANALDDELRSFINLLSLIPSKGHSGILPPIQRLAPPTTTAAPAPDDRRRAIWAFMTVRPLRVP